MHTLKLRKIVSYITTAFERSIKYLCVISGILLFAIIVLISVSTISRFFFQRPIAGTLEFSLFFFVFAVFFAITYVQAQKQNIRVHFFFMRLPPIPRKILNVFTHVSCVVFFSAVTWQTAIDSWGSWIIKQAVLGAVAIPVYPAKFAISFCCALITIQFLRDTFLILRSKA